MSSLLSIIKRGLIWFCREFYYLMIEYLVVIVPFLIVAFLPIPILAKAIATIVLLIASIIFYSRWRKSTTKRKRNVA